MFRFVPVLLITLMMGGYLQQATAQVPGLLAQARQLMADGKHSDAYTLLVSHEHQYAGQLAYDVLLAQSALNSRQANLALFSLERARIQHPAQAQVMWLMANTYAVLGHDQNAIRELNLLLKQSTASRYVQPANRLLEQLQQRQKRTSLQAYLGVQLGNDSNANSATASSIFLGFELSDTSTETASIYEQAVAGAKWIQRVGSKHRLMTALDLRRNQYPDAEFVNNDKRQLQLAWQLPQRYQVVWQQSQTEVADKLNNQARHLYLVLHGQHWVKPLYFIRRGELEYLPEQSTKDADVYQLGMQLPLNNGRDQLVFSLSQDRTKTIDSPYARDYLALQYRKKARFMKRFTADTSLAGLYSDYKEPYLGQTRTDNVHIASLRVTYVPNRQWEAALDLSYTDAQSSIVLYDYDRLTVGMSIKRYFAR
ncbi:MAG: hypothetical protein HUJ30_05580 [Gammaproteobacteria bacterium]|nr:hypothetical protein [Gammaproteobacteria bacterium]